jgi:hypothetical protein
VTIREAAVRASTHGKEPARFSARMASYTRGDRARRALRRFLPIFGVGCLVVVIPPHIPWITGFTLTGLVLGLQRYRQAGEILELRGGCPECASEQQLEPPAGLPAIQRCPGCGAFLKLEELAA